MVTRQNIRKVYPRLAVLPRPEPAADTKESHDGWQQEYEQWGTIMCPCGRGYFCRQHGSWISGEEVGTGVAAAQTAQAGGSCPSYHYGG